MTGNYRCGDYAALTGYLYDDCEPEERGAIDAHVKTCAACADELRAMSATRRQLASWAPPETSLGFRIAPSDESRVVPFVAAERRDASPDWWTRPLPAWAQIAAALVIFAAGLSIGVVRGRAETQPEMNPQVRAALDVLNRRVSGIEQVSRRAVQTVPAAREEANEAAIIMRQVGHQIARSEERQRQDWQQELRLRVLQGEDTRRLQVEQIEANVAVVANDVSLLRRMAFER